MYYSDLFSDKESKKGRRNEREARATTSFFGKKKNRMSSILLLKNSGFRGFLIRFLSFCDFEQKSKDNDVCVMLNQTTVARFRNDIIFRKIKVSPSISMIFDSIIVEIDAWNKFFPYMCNRRLILIF